jgi:hypothetical protein
MAAALVSLVLVAPLGAQAIPRGAPQDGATKLQSPLKIALSVGGQTYEFSGIGRCTYAPGAAWFNRPGANWVVQVKPAVTTGLRSFGLNLWRLSGGEPNSMFELYLVIDRSDRRISTMNGGTTNGSGTVVLAPRDSGGVFTIDGKTREGVDIHATVDCERFRLPSSAVAR